MAKVFTITEGLENMGALKTGGQGSVYKGRRIGEIITAVKLLPTPVHSESADDKNFTDFQNEVAKLKKVNEKPNPNVVKILSSGITESGSLPFIEMEFIEGPDLEELLQPPHEALFTIKESIKVAEHLSNALAHCHNLNIKHGDIKSNNVKFNIHTANYVLLDFGLAIMSDEQRRTSLRHAGAIEFMAPEQNEGQMLFETDVYSFGVILFELLAGQVPFPLTVKGETARNMVMVAHMETAPPDLLSLRKKNLPQTWSAEKQEREVNVPGWLISLIYKCLEKKPASRFSTGHILHEYIVLNSTLPETKAETNNNQLYALQGEKDKLVKENEQLKNTVFQYQRAADDNAQQLTSLRNALAAKEEEMAAVRNQVYAGRSRKGVSKASFFSLLFITACLAAVAAFSLLSDGKEERNQRTVSDVKTTPEETTPLLEEPPKKTVIGQYKVQAAKAFFHNQPNESTRRNAWMTPSDEVLDALYENNGFVYVEFTNSRGQVSKGWLRLRDLISLQDWEQQNTPLEPQQPLSKIEINRLLQQAKGLQEGNNIADALIIYKALSEQEVPEAMYHYGNLALLGKNNDIDCGTALQLVKTASDKNVTEAKRTLGFLYVFAGSPEAIRLRGYNRCEYEKNIVKGSRLLMEAVLAGDTSARNILEMQKREGSSGENN